jgi:hypothetical protein
MCYCLDPVIKLPPGLQELYVRVNLITLRLYLDLGIELMIYGLWSRLETEELGWCLGSQQGISLAPFLIRLPSENLILTEKQKIYWRLTSSDNNPAAKSMH